MKLFKKPIDQDKFELLIDFNRAIGLVFFFQALLLLFFTNNTSVEITGIYILKNPVTENLTSIVREIFSIHIGTLVAGSLLITAFTHFFISLPSVGKTYWENLQKERQPIRWIEYGASSAIIVIILCLLLGITDYVSIAFAAGLQSSLCLFGAFVEHMREKRGASASIYAIAIASTYEIIIWTTITVHILANLSVGISSIPVEAILVCITTAILFILFPLHILLNILKIGPWKDYLFTERILIMTSLCTKSIFAWSIFVLYLS